MDIRIPLSVKVGLATGLLSVGLTSGGLYLFYSRSAQLLTEQISSRLRDIGHLASLQISPADRAAILSLKQQSLENLAVSEAEIQSIAPGEFQLGLDPVVSETLMATPQFQRVVHLMREIDQASLPEIDPPAPTYQQLDGSTADLATYLMVTLPQSPEGAVIMFVGSSRHEAIGDWPGNPVGNLYGVSLPLFADVFDGEAQTSGIYKDDFGTWITAAIPLKDPQGQVYAALGLDYDLSNEANQLRVLQLICLGILGVSLVLAVILSVVLARWLGKPLAQLKDAATRVQARDFSATVAINSQDELGLLGQAFNSMVGELRSYAQDLEAKVSERTQELQAANQEISILNDRLKAENLRMGAELEITRRLQQMILPQDEELQGIPDLEVAGFMESASEVGGDYYDVLHHNGQLTIGIGDVTGHGLESGVLMIMAQTAVRTLQAANIKDPHQYISAINQAIYGNIQRMNSDKNMTLAVLDYHDGVLTLSGQHEEMLVIRKDGSLERIDTLDLGFPIGLEENIASFISQVRVQLQPEDVAVLYTDGITEAENDNREQYGLDRLCQIASDHRHRSAQEIRQRIVDDVRGYIGSQKVFDDITLVVIKQK